MLWVLVEDLALRVLGLKLSAVAGSGCRNRVRESRVKEFGLRDSG